MKSNAHNLSSLIKEAGLFGIEFRLPEEDTFNLILGTNWKYYRWYALREERDQAYQELKKEHAYSRIGDAPTILLSKIVRDPTKA
jgi:hypothetical protein